jgi:oligoribonuclease NrnB/cAMP/cGMP phosphodiesterase (DHH superfamily)
MIYIYYHGKDLDGKCSAAIAYQYYVKAGHMDIQLIAIDYGKEELLNRTFTREDIVLMLDWSASNTPDVMCKIRNEAMSFIWIDHHKTAIDNMAEARPGAYFEGLRVVGKSGCELTWRYFNTEETPDIVTMLGRYDVWDTSYIDGFDILLDLQAGMKLNEWEPYNSMWKRLFEKPELIEDYLADGRIIRQYQQGRNKIACSLGFEAIIAGYKIFATNTIEKSSQTFESLGDKYDIYCAFSFNGKLWDYSLYSTKVDVSEICKLFGGGGHKGAAGFQSKKMVLFSIAKFAEAVVDTCSAINKFHQTGANMQPFQQRVIEERNELLIKLAKLDDFIESTTCMILPIDERNRLEKQRQIMLDYVNVLNERIDNFKEQK